MFKNGGISMFHCIFLFMFTDISANCGPILIKIILFARIYFQVSPHHTLQPNHVVWISRFILWQTWLHCRNSTFCGTHGSQNVNQAFEALLRKLTSTDVLCSSPKVFYIDRLVYYFDSVERLYSHSYFWQCSTSFDTFWRLLAKLEPKEKCQSE